MNNSDGSRGSAGDQIIVTGRLVRRIIDYAISDHGYDPNVRSKQLDLKALDDFIRWDDAVRASNPSERYLQ